jgi:DNA-3-methyladenine glycosylase I
MVTVCWGEVDERVARYHDEEWGKPVHDDRLLFEFLILEGFQAGLSWSTILNKREAFRQAFDGFEAVRIAAYGPEEISRLMADTGIVRNRLKCEASVKNARAFLELQAGHGSFDRYIWSFTGGGTLEAPPPASMAEVPATTPESDAMSKALKKAGMTFVGSTICYAFMQATGMVNDHLATCPAR